MGCSIGGRIVLHLALSTRERSARWSGWNRRRMSSAITSGVAQSRRRAWRPGVRRRGVRADRADRRRATGRWGDAMALHAKRAGRVQRRPAFFYMIDGDIRGKLGEIDITRCPLFPADRRVRLFLHRRGHFGGGRGENRRAGHHHEGARAFPDERGPGEVHLISFAGAGEDQGALSRNRPSGLSVSGSKVSTSTAPASSIVTTMWSAPTAVESTLAPAGSAAVTSTKALDEGALPQVKNAVADDAEHSGNRQEGGHAGDHHQPAHVRDRALGFPGLNGLSSDIA